MMKKIRIFLCVGMCCLLAACAGKDGERKETDGHVRVTGGQSEEEGNDQECGQSEEAGSDQDGQEDAREGDLDGFDAQPEIPQEPEEADASELFFETTDPTEILLENPSQEYYLTEPVASESDAGLTLKLLTEEANEITDTEDWFRENELPPFDSFHMEDDTYRYEIVGDNYASGYLLNIYRKENSMFLKCLDFSNYRYTDNIKPGDEAFVEQRVWWAQSVGDVLYVAVAHNTYTESCPHTGYLVAIDINDAHVIWKSAPCMTNGRNFEIIGDTIVCGYGFTAEPDYLNLVSRLDGSLLEQIPVKSMADYIIRKDDTLYVRTYHTDYTYQICQPAESQ